MNSEHEPVFVTNVTKKGKNHDPVQREYEDDGSYYQPAPDVAESDNVIVGAGSDNRQFEQDESNVGITAKTEQVEDMTDDHNNTVKEENQQEDDDDEEDIEDEKLKAISRLPAQHSRGLMSTLIGLAGPDIQNRKPEPLPIVRPMKVEDEVEKYLGAGKNTGNVSSTTFLESGITPSMLAEADLELGNDGNTLYPDDIGRETDKKEFFCKLCQKQTTSLGNFRDHLNGKGHKSMLDAVKQGKKLPIKGKKKATKALTELGQKSVCLDIVEGATQPILGLSFVTEFHSTNGVVCVCNLCTAKFDHNIVVSHVTGNKHRLRYMKEKKPAVYVHLKKFGGKKSQLSAFLNDLSIEAESEDGRGVPVIKVYEPEKRFGDDGYPRKDDPYSDSFYNSKHLKAFQDPDEADAVEFQDWVNREVERSREIYDAKKNFEKSGSNVDFGTFLRQSSFGRSPNSSNQGQGRSFAFGSGLSTYPGNPTHNEPRQLEPRQFEPRQMDSHMPVYSSPAFPAFKMPSEPPRGPDSHAFLPMPPMPPMPLFHQEPLPPVSSVCYQPTFELVSSADKHLDMPEPTIIKSSVTIDYEHGSSKKDKVASSSRISSREDSEKWFNSWKSSESSKISARSTADQSENEIRSAGASSRQSTRGTAEKWENDVRSSGASSRSSARDTAEKWENDIQNILGKDAHRKELNSLALLSSTYSSPERSPSPSAKIKVERSLPFSKSYIETNRRLTSRDKEERRNHRSEDQESRHPPRRQHEKQSSNNPERQRSLYSRSSRSRSPVMAKHRPRRSRSKSPVMIKSQRMRHSRSRSPVMSRQQRPGRSRSHSPVVSRKQRIVRSRTPVMTKQQRSIRSRSRSPAPSKSQRLRQSRSRSPRDHRDSYLVLHEVRNPSSQKYALDSHTSNQASSKQRMSPPSSRGYRHPQAAPQGKRSMSPEEVKPKRLPDSARSSKKQSEEEKMETDTDAEAERIANLLLEISSTLSGKEDPQAALKALFSNAALASALLGTKGETSKGTSSKSDDHASSRQAASPRQGIRHIETDQSGRRHDKYYDDSRNLTPPRQVRQYAEREYADVSNKPGTSAYYGSTQPSKYESSPEDDSYKPRSRYKIEYF